MKKSNDVVKQLKENEDLEYKKFSERIIDTNYPIIGVRTPIIKKIAKSTSQEILEENDEKYYEEVMLKLFVISNIKNIEEYDYYFNKYIYRIDCWSLCDSFVVASKIIKRNKDHYFEIAKELLNNEKEFVVRIGLVILLNYHVEEKYLSSIFRLVDNIKREEYYIKMAIAWLLSICYIKYPKETLCYLDKTKLDDFTYNKTISKICDSYRVDKNTKEELKKKRRN